MLMRQGLVEFFTDNNVFWFWLFLLALPGFFFQSCFIVSLVLILSPVTPLNLVVYYFSSKERTCLFVHIYSWYYKRNLHSIFSKFTTYYTKGVFNFTHLSVFSGMHGPSIIGICRVTYNHSWTYSVVHWKLSNWGWPEINLVVYFYLKFCLKIYFIRKLRLQKF